LTTIPWVFHSGGPLSPQAAEQRHSSKAGDRKEMPRVVRVKDTRLNRDYGFLYVLKTAEDLTAYVEKVVKKRMLAGFKDACKAENGSQTTTAEGAAICLIARAQPSSLLGATAYLQDQLNQHGSVMANGKGGYCSLLPHCKVVEEVKVGRWTLPRAKPISPVRRRKASRVRHNPARY
jgi:hypothetical protein